MPSSAQVRLFAQVVFWIALVAALWLTLGPSPGQGGGRWVDKIQHAIGFYGLTGLAAAAFARRPLLMLGAAMLALGAVIEVLQATPAIGRDAEWADLLADAVGIAAALAPQALPAWRRFVRGERATPAPD